MNNILYKENELESLITNFENEKNKIETNLIEIEQTLKKVEEVWQSNAEVEFKKKQDEYIKQFATIKEELEQELKILKEAKQTYQTGEKNINQNIEIITEL